MIYKCKSVTYKCKSVIYKCKSIRRFEFSRQNVTKKIWKKKQFFFFFWKSIPALGQEWFYAMKFLSGKLHLAGRYENSCPADYVMKILGMIVFWTEMNT